MQSIMRNYYEEIYAKKFENLDEMDKFLEKKYIITLNWIKKKQKVWTD